MKTIILFLFLVVSIKSQSLLFLMDSETTPPAKSSTYTAGADYVWNHLTETNNALLESWEDTVSNLAIYVATDYAPYNNDSGVVWTDNDEYLRQASSFPAGLFDGALTIEVVVKIASLDATQMLFGARNASNVAMGIAISLEGTFVGGILDITNSRNYVHNSTASLGWHYLVFTWDGATAYHFYVDGEEVEDMGDDYGSSSYPTDNRIGMGATNSSAAILSGTLTPFVVIRKEVISATQVLNNFESTVIKNQIPEWAR